MKLHGMVVSVNKQSRPALDFRQRIFQMIDQRQPSFFCTRKCKVSEDSVNQNKLLKFHWYVFLSELRLCRKKMLQMHVKEVCITASLML